MILNRPQVLYSRTIENLNKNTLTFENATTREFYEDPNIPSMEKTVTNLTFFEIPIFDLLPAFRAKSYYQRFHRNDIQKYEFKPKLLSFDLYKYTDFWYIILAMNGYSSVYDFKNFKVLELPKLEVVEEYIDKLKYTNPDIGFYV